MHVGVLDILFLTDRRVLYRLRDDVSKLGSRIIADRPLELLLGARVLESFWIRETLEIIALNLDCGQLRFQVLDAVGPNGLEVKPTI